MATKQATKLQQLKAQQDKLKARIQAIEARQKVSVRKQDTRKKILIGSFFLDKAEKENNMAELVKQIDKFLTRNSDRSLFDLPPIEK